jgi:hypothetical protein
MMERSGEGKYLNEMILSCNRIVLPQLEMDRVFFR